MKKCDVPQHFTHCFNQKKTATELAGSVMMQTLSQQSQLKEKMSLEQ